VVTPNFNQGDFLEQTILSVLDQAYPNLEFIIIDGGSSDGSKEIISKYEDRLHYWVSEKDEGMYHAINKGFSRSTGDIMCWINSDDVLWQNSLSYIAEVFSENNNIHWLQGYPSVIDEDGNLLYQREPVALKHDFYKLKFVKDCAFIQQESTFWSRELWEKSDGRLNTQYRLAADFDLWMQFFHHARLYCSHRQLAAFRKRSGQQSADQETYIKEALESVATHKKKLTIKERLHLGLNITGEVIPWID